MNLKRFALISLLGMAALWYHTHKAPIEALRIGVTAGPHAHIVAFVAQRMQAEFPEGKVLIREFNDFILPNIALNDGSLDLNCYQHGPFLEEQIRSRGYKHIAAKGPNILLPMGLYSQKFPHPEALPQKARIALPNDPSNGGRALLLLAALHLIELKPNCGVTACLKDITQNPKNFQFIEVEAPQLPRILPDVDAALINTDWVLLSRLPITPIASEDTQSPYVNSFAVNTRSPHKEKIELFLKYYYAPETRAFIEKEYAGRIVPGW